VDHISVGDLGVGHVFPELLVLVSGHFTLLARPDCTERVNNLSVKFDGERNELREFLDGLLAERLLGELSAGRQKSERDFSSSFEVKLVNIRDLVLASAVRNPLNSGVARLLRVDYNVVRHDKTGVESNTELTDNVVRSL